MRHRKSFNHLSRKPAHRKAMLSNMATSLILKKRITTTTAKAKALRSYVEPLLTKAKDDTTHSRREVFSHLQDKEAVTELFREISPKIMDRPGGYTRILKIGNRLGDNADMAIIELVDYNENLVSQKPAKSTGKRRRRGGSKASAPKAEETTVQETAESKEVEEVKAEETPATDTVTEETKVAEETAVAEEVVEEKKEEADKPVDETPEVKAETNTDDAPETAEEKKDEEEKKEEK